jgi:hypothetical protein
MPYCDEFSTCPEYDDSCHSSATPQNSCFKTQTKATKSPTPSGQAEFDLLDGISEKLTGLINDMSNGFYDDTSQALGQIELHGDKVEIQLVVTRNPDNFLL